MNSGWIKLHRKLLDNDALFRGGSTFPVWCYLLLRADRSGVVTTGRLQIAQVLKMKPSTVYIALKRLENLTMIQQQPNNQKTVIRICNWATYQAQYNTDINEVQQVHNTIQEVRSKNKKVTTTEKEDIEKVYNHFITSFKKNDKQYKLSEQRKTKIKVRLRDCGIDMLLKAITNASRDDFYAGNNDRNWSADIDYITRNYEIVERLSNLTPKSKAYVPEIHKPQNKPIPELSDEDRAKARVRIAKIKADLIKKQAEKHNSSP
jgi:hypothetical protein